MTKILAHDIRMKKNPHTKEDNFWIFTDFQGVMSKVQLVPPHGNFICGVASYFFKYFVLTDILKKKLLL